MKVFRQALFLRCMRGAADTLRICWQTLRALSGDDAYERYLQTMDQSSCQCEAAHPPLTRAQFFQQSQDEKWQGIKRCC